MYFIKIDVKMFIFVVKLDFKVKIRRLHRYKKS